MILLTFISVLWLILLELNKNTLAGWILTIAVVVAFYYLRKQFFGGKPWYIKTSGWGSLIVLLLLVL